MNTGPGRNSNSAVRWLKIDAPVTSEGIRSGVNWTRAKPSAGHGRERPRDQRLGQPRVILDQDVAVRQHRAERELERRSLADNGALDLVENSVRAPGNLGQRKPLIRSGHAGSASVAGASTGAGPPSNTRPSICASERNHALCS